MAGTPNAVKGHSVVKAEAVEHKQTTAGWLSHLPLSTIPYVQLMRLDRFNGYWYFWLPHFYGTLLVGKELKVPRTEFLCVNALLVWGVLIMRGANCTWNDTVDAPFDRQVSRCKNRPVARGAISTGQALVFTAVQMVLSMLTLCFLPQVTYLFAVPAVIGWFLYPLAKRVTHYPQVVLGVPIAGGIFMGAAALGSDPLNLEPLLLDLKEASSASPYLSGLWGITIKSSPIYAFYCATVLWTLLYELIYSHQDAPENIATGVKTLVLLYADTSGPEIKFTTLSLLVKLAVGQIVFLSIAGASGAGDALYFTGTVAGAAAATAVVLSKCHLTEPVDCGWWCKVGCCFFTGGAMATGLVGEYVLTLLEE